jgi:hypothetical protein
MPPDDGGALAEVFGLMVSHSERSIGDGVRLRISVRYTQLGLEVIAEDWLRRGRKRVGGYSGGSDWKAWACGLFADTPEGGRETNSTSLQALIAAAFSRGESAFDATGFVATEETVSGAVLELTELNPAGVPGRRPGSRMPWHFREMLDPSLVLSSIEPSGAVKIDGAFVLEGRPRIADMAHGYYAAIVHTYGDRWIARIDAATGIIREAKTELGGKLLSSHELSEW